MGRREARGCGMNVLPFEQVRKQELNYTCSACGADRGCDCNAPAIKKAAAAIADNPQKSDRAIGAEAGISHTTVQNARKQVANDLPPEAAEVRIGRDGKSYNKKKKKPIAPLAPTVSKLARRQTEFVASIDAYGGGQVDRVEEICARQPELITDAVLDKCREITERWGQLCEDLYLVIEDKRAREAQGNSTDPDASAEAMKAAMAAEAAELEGGAA
jgi:hypothetical protein